MARHTVVHALRFTLITLVSIGLVVAPTTEAWAATSRTIGELKSAKQFQAEAARYDLAIRAIGSIGTMSLQTQADLGVAGKILQQHAASLELLTSKFVVAAYQDRTFTQAIARNFGDERSAAAFARRLNADYRTVEQLDGAKALEKRLLALASSNAAILQKSAENLRVATLRITGKGQGVQPKYLPRITSGVWYVIIIAALVVAALTFPALALGIAAYAALFAPAAVLAFLASPFNAALAVLFGSVLVGDIFGDEASSNDGSSGGGGSDAGAAGVEACIDAAIERNEQCIEDAGRAATASERVTAQYACATKLAAEQTVCSLVAALY